MGSPNTCFKHIDLRGAVKPEGKCFLNRRGPKGTQEDPRGPKTKGPKRTKEDQTFQSNQFKLVALKLFRATNLMACSETWLVPGWFLVGSWMVLGWSLVGSWLVQWVVRNRFPCCSEIGFELLFSFGFCPINPWCSKVVHWWSLRVGGWFQRT